MQLIELGEGCIMINTNDCYPSFVFERDDAWNFVCSIVDSDVGSTMKIVGNLVEYEGDTPDDIEITIELWNGAAALFIDMIETEEPYDTED